MPLKGPYRKAKFSKKEVVVENVIDKDLDDFSNWEDSFKEDDK